MSGPVFRRRADLGGWLLLGALLLGWETAARTLPPGQLPPVSQVVAVLADPAMLRRLAEEGGLTIGRTVAGFAVGGAVGLLLGLSFGLSPALRRALGPLVAGLRPLPSAALIPPAILFVGLGDGLNVALAAFACAWPIMVNAQDGVRGVSPVLLDTARTLGLSRGEAVRRVILPAALPRTLTGLRLGLGIALAVETSVEMVVPDRGLGALAAEAALSGRGAALYAAVVAAGLAGWGLDRLCERLEARLLRGYGPERRTGS